MSEEESLEEMSREMMRSLKERFGDPLPKFMHLACGWGGAELTEDDKCPQCGESFPPE